MIPALEQVFPDEVVMHIIKFSTHRCAKTLKDANFALNDNAYSMTYDIHKAYHKANLKCVHYNYNYETKPYDYNKHYENLLHAKERKQEQDELSRMHEEDKSYATILKVFTTESIQLFWKTKHTIRVSDIDFTKDFRGSVNKE